LTPVHFATVDGLTIQASRSFTAVMGFVGVATAAVNVTPVGPIAAMSSMPRPVNGPAAAVSMFSTRNRPQLSMVTWVPDSGAVEPCAKSTALYAAMINAHGPSAAGDAGLHSTTAVAAA